MNKKTIKGISLGLLLFSTQLAIENYTPINNVAAESIQANKPSITLNGKQYTSLSEAIKVAQNGDTLILSEGKYSLMEPLFIDKKITLKAEGKVELQSGATQGINLVSIKDKGNLIVEGSCIFNGNNKSSKMPLIYVEKGGQLLLGRDTEIKNVKMQTDGGGLINEGNCVIKGSFSNCSARRDAAFTNKGKMTIESTAHFTNGYASQGVAVGTNYGKLILNHPSFENNRTAGAISCIRSWYDSKITINGARFTYNRSNDKTAIAIFEDVQANLNQETAFNEEHRLLLKKMLNYHFQKRRKSIIYYYM